MLRMNRIIVSGWAAVAMGLCLAGCEQPGIHSGAAATLAASEGSPAYLDRIASAKTVSENDAMRGILMLLDGEDKAATFQQRVNVLMSRKIVDPSWGFRADRPITRGKLAYMTYQACHMTGGVTLTLTGPSQRYCLLELQYLRMMTPGAMYTPVSGMEFVAVLTRADHYLQTGAVPEVIRGSAGE